MSHNTNSKRKAIVIGAGIAGLASAIRLAVKGFEVTVFEKNAYPGGKLCAFKQDGFSFDAGPSLFTQPSHIKALFDLAQEPIDDYFQYCQVPVTCKYFYENGKQLEATTDTGQFAINIEAALGEPGHKVKKYLQQSAKAYNNIGDLFITHSLHKYATLFSRQALKAIGATRYSYLFKSLHQHNKASFSTPEAVQLFNRYATYNGSNPYKAPAMLSVISHLEMNEGVFYPAGGMISITNALYRLAERKDVQFRFNTGVDRIIHHEEHVAGVVVNGKNYYADVVVSNCDVYFTYKHLLNDEVQAKKILKQERSSSAIVF
jgi:phytoene desaturase